jgi:hypothetical protein
MIKTVIGIDPGKSIGFARWDVEDKEIKFQDDRIIQWDLFCVMLDQLEEYAKTLQEPLTIVCESFVLFGHRAQQQVGSKFETCEVIGTLKYVARRSNGKINLVMQPSSLNTTAAKFSGRGVDIVEKKGHLPDNVSASNHAHYWLVTNGFLRNRILDA